MLPKILIVTDVEGWAFWISAQQLKKHLTNFDIDVITQRDFEQKQYDLDRKYDNVYFMNYLYRRIPQKYFLSSVNSHRFEIDRNDLASHLIPKYKAVSCISRKIYDILVSQYPNQNFYCCENGVDLELFTPKPSLQQKKFVVGFVGRETRGSFKEDLKGFHSILLPLKERMSIYPEIEFLIHSNNHETKIPHTEMEKIYHQMDCFLVTSYREGTGMTMEASACAIPSLCTDVGVCSRVVMQDDNIVAPMGSETDIRRTLDFFEERILYMAADREYARGCGLTNRTNIELNWQWKTKAKEWEPLFLHGIKEKVRTFDPDLPRKLFPGVKHKRYLVADD